MNAPPPAQPSIDAVREVVHDFNNLLTAIIGAAEAVLERSGTDPETRTDIAHIREGARRGAALVQRLRAGASEAVPGLISVSGTIRTTSRLLAHHLGAKNTLTLELCETGDRVRADASQLDRVMLNLITNARHAMPDGGTATLGVARRSIAVSEQHVPDMIPPGDYVVIAVADTGDGIAPGQMSRIFQPGFSSWRYTEGSGLGLSSVREIVRRANGFLAVDSHAGSGTRFEIYLPRQEDEALAVKEPRRVATAGTVLLVEDDPLVRQVTERVLRRAGWIVLCADSAEAALEILKESACDLMISDVIMPGMDGVSLARRVRTWRAELPVILMSGYEPTEPGDGLETGNFTFLAKPYDQRDLLGAVARIVGERVD